MSGPAIRAAARWLADRAGATTRVRGVGNRIERGNARLRNVSFDIEGDDNIVLLGSDCQLTNVRFHLRGRGHSVIIGAHCRFFHGGELWLEDGGGRLLIGEGTTFENAHLAVTEPGSALIIGRDCMFAQGIDVRTGDSHPILDAATGARLNPARDVVIGDHVWVAAHASILKGSVIRQDSVVATRAVVAGLDAPPGAVLAGSPAKVVRTGVTWARDRRAPLLSAAPGSPW